MNKQIKRLIQAKAKYKTTYSEVAKAIGVSNNTITNWVKKGFSIKEENEKNLKKYLDSL